MWLQSHCRPPPAAAAQFLVVVAIRIWQQRKIAWYKAGRGAVFVRYRRMGLFREVTPHRPTCAVIAYTDASFWDDAIEFAVRFDPAVFQTAKHRAGRIMTETAVETLWPEGWMAGGAECDRCPFSRVCGRIRTTVPIDAIAAPSPHWSRRSSPSPARPNIGAKNTTLQPSDYGNSST